ncbi:MAG: hypothetical protein LBR15_10250, partial [Methanobrevibacter sp.]|nr:hypothetical protein [Candidatus Methanovirga australis]
MISLKKMLFVFALSACILSVSANPIHLDKSINSILNPLIGDNDVVYVSVDGTGDGSSPNSPLGSMKQALNISKPNGIIKVSNGVYKGIEHTGIMIDKNITIEGDSDTVFDGGKINFIFMANGQGLNVNVSNIKFKNAYSQHGPGYHGYASVNHLKNCVFEDNTADAGAGATGFSNAVAVLENCTFKGNSADQFAGATSSWVGSNVTLIKCVYENNTVNKDGACIRATGSQLTVIDTTFKNNQAGINGIIHADENAEVNIINTIFANNSADFGGAIYIDNAKLNVLNSEFNDNEASNGGAISINGKSNANISNSIFTNNSADGNGGAINMEDGVLSVDNSKFVSNFAKTRGAGIYNHRGKFTINGTDFDGNCLTTDTGVYYMGGGAIFNDLGNDSTITRSKFNDNKANKAGGAI